jgi:hypothetical protein
MKKNVILAIDNEKNYNIISNEIDCNIINNG